MSLIDKISNKMEQFVDELSKKYDDVDEELDDELDDEDLDDDEELDDELEDDELDEDDEDEVVEPGNDKQNEQVKHNAENAINKNWVNESVRPEASIASIKASGDKIEDKKNVRKNRNTSSKQMHVPSNETKEIVNKRDMLYDERLEALIDMALADGVLTGKEKQVLFKNAKEQGIDLDEFEMVLDAKVAKIKKGDKAKSPTERNKHGNTRKCPACGELVDGITMRCKLCGYSFVDVETNPFVRDLMDKWNRIEDEIESNIKRHWWTFEKIRQDRIEELKEKKEIEFLHSIPVPTSIEDCIATLDFCYYKINRSNGAAPLWRDFYASVFYRVERDALNNKELQQYLEPHRKYLEKSY